MCLTLSLATPAPKNLISLLFSPSAPISFFNPLQQAALLVYLSVNLASKSGVGLVAVTEVDDIVDRRVDDLQQVVEAHQRVDPLKIC